MNDNNLSGSTVHGADSGDLEVGKKVGEGQEGIVYRIKGDSDFAIKIFNNPDEGEKEEKIRCMIQNAPVDPTFEEKNERSIVWPEEEIYDPTDEFLGYKMEYKDLSNYQNIRKYSHTELSWDSSDQHERYTTALNFSLLIKAIHVQGHALGDLNHQNILVKDSLISLIDCDAFHIKGNKVYPGDTIFGRYTPPEGRGDTIEKVKKADRFGLGVHIFQILMEAFHPYQAGGQNSHAGKYKKMIVENGFPYIKTTAEDPHDKSPDYENIDPKVKNLFEDCFQMGENNPELRPTADEWVDTLRDIIDVETETVKVSTTGSSNKSSQNQSTTSNKNSTHSTPDPDPVPVDVAKGKSTFERVLPSFSIPFKKELKRLMKYIVVISIILFMLTLVFS